MPDPTFRSQSNDTDGSFAVATDSATVPAGTAEGDGMVIFYDSAVFTGGGGAPAHTTPSGWTLVGSGTYAGTVLDGRLSIYGRVAGASEAATTLTSSVAAAHNWRRLSYTNAHPIDWVSNVTAVFGYTANGTTHTLSSVTTTRRRQLVLYNLAASTTAGITFTDGSASLTERVDANSASTYELIADAVGAVGTKDITSSAADRMMWGIAVFNGHNVAQRYMGMKLRGR